MYETILSCPNCGKEVKLVADDVVADRDRLRAALHEARRDLIRVNVTNHERRRGQLAVEGIDKIDAAIRSSHSHSESEK